MENIVQKCNEFFLYDFPMYVQDLYMYIFMTIGFMIYDCMIVYVGFDTCIFLYTTGYIYDHPIYVYIGYIFNMHYILYIIYIFCKKTSIAVSLAF